MGRLEARARTGWADRLVTRPTLGLIVLMFLVGLVFAIPMAFLLSPVAAILTPFVFVVLVTAGWLGGKIREILGL
jgi:Fe2+ transport system protein B